MGDIFEMIVAFRLVEAYAEPKTKLESDEDGLRVVRTLSRNYLIMF